MIGTHHSFLRTGLLRALPLVLAAACASYGPAPDNGGGVAGAPEAVRCGRGRGNSDTEAIGGRGGTVALNRHSLLVPKDAVGTSITFSMMEVASTSIRVELGPDGTTFETPATLELSFARCGGFPRGFRNLQILQVDGNDSVIAVLPSTVDMRHKSVRAPLRHLSGYLIGGNRDGGT